MTGAPTVRRPLVLVVDDEAGIRALVGDTLVQAGFDVEAVSSGRERKYETCCCHSPWNGDAAGLRR